MCSCLRRPTSRLPLVGRRRRSCTPIWIRSMHRWNSATIPACGASRSRSAAEWCSPRATRRSAFGVRSAMSGSPARRLCPNLIDVPARFDAYVEASKAVFDDLPRHVADRRGHVDRRGVHRCRGTVADRRNAARDRRPTARRVATEVGLPITVGVARTKFLAKVASGVGKPDGLLVVEPVGELEFLHPLPVQTALGRRCDHRRPSCTNAVCAPSPTWRRCRRMPSRRSSGGAPAVISTPSRTTIDPRRVTTGHRRRSIGSQQALGRRRRSATRSTSSCAGSSTA